MAVGTGKGKRMKERLGKPLPLGVAAENGKMNFSVAVPEGKDCSLLLYRAGDREPYQEYPMEAALGEVRCLGLEDIEDCMEYNYRIGDEIVVDPRAKSLPGREIWGEERDIQKHQVRGVLREDPFDWEGDVPLDLPLHQVIAYSLHVRGFTKDAFSKVKDKGTFEGVIEKLPYLKELGINQIQCMPVYEFQECGRYRNYWGYGPAWYFAPKSAYSACGNGPLSLKQMVKACHQEGIEVALEMPFAEGTPGFVAEDCLRYYRMEYHIDGFILNPLNAPMESVCQDPILKKTKILRHDLEFMNTMRRFLKGDEGMVDSVIYWLRHVTGREGAFNSITGHTGFTLNDLVSYDGKHNEANGENNEDGPDYNYSWNCGAEGPTRKKAVQELRERQRRNGMFLLLTAQGTPCLLAGDEFGNSQKGNNNVYCQDNPTGWLNWRKLEKEKEFFRFVKELIYLRKSYPVLCPAEEMRGMDQTRCGVPDVSYHGENAWQVSSEVSSRQLGVYYSGAVTGGEDCFVAYNMHWLEHRFAIPALPKGKEWYVAATTDEGILEQPRRLKKQRQIELKARTIMILAGRQKADEP